MAITLPSITLRKRGYIVVHHVDNTRLHCGTHVDNTKYNNFVYYHIFLDVA